MIDRRARFGLVPRRRRRPVSVPIRVEALEGRALLTAIVPADFDGDGHSDFAVYAFDEARGAGRFSIERSGLGPREVDFGGAADRPIAGDYTGDGRADPGVYGYSPDDGFSRFAILPSDGSPALLQPFGGFDDRPVAEDFDGDGLTDVAVFGYSPDDGFSRFAVLLSGGRTGEHPGGVIMFPFGGPDDAPTVGDFDGDGRSDFGVYGPDGDGSSRFAIALSGGPSAEHPSGTIVRSFGGLDDIPAIGDYDGDGRSDVAVAGFSPLEGFRRFAILPSDGDPGRSVPFGGFDDLPVPLDPGGDGVTDIAVFGYSPVEQASRFAVLPSTGLAYSVPMGGPVAVPLPPPAFVPAPAFPPDPAPDPDPDPTPDPNPGRPPFQIDWVNRGTATDRFSAAERLVIDRAIEVWEGLILSNGRPDNALRITFEGGAHSGLDMGSTIGLATVRYDATGPFDATIQLDADGGSRGWYVDPTPGDDLEFSTAATPTFLTGGPPSQFDLLSTVVHEIGHALGLGIGFGDRFSDRLSPLPDGAGMLYRGPTGVSAVLTPELDHLDPITHAYDLMTTEAFVGTRAYPTELNLRLLTDAYGYRVLLPDPLPDARASRIVDARISSAGFGGSVVTVDFDEGIDLIGASDVAHYRLLRPQGDDFAPVSSPFASASFDVGLLRLTLRLRGGIQPLPGWRLVVSDTLTDPAGNRLDGDLDGLPGGDAVLTLRA